MASRRFLWVVFLIGLSSIASEAQNSTPDPPGTLIDLGGTHVHIYCAGSGSPPVVFLHGLGDYSFDWALIQPRVAEKTKACAYDRPAQAWSQPGPPPRGIKTSAHELHLLLQRSNIDGPYILVGHSWGGLIARMYANEYPKEVAGMVLVDSTHEDEYLWINGKIIRPRFMTEDEWSALTKPKKAANKAPSDDSVKQNGPPSPAVAKLEAPFDKLSPDVQKLRMWAMSQPFSKARFEGGDTLDFRSDFIDMHKVTAQSDHPLQNIPLIVLSKTPSIDNDDDYTPDQLAWNQTLQAPLARLSTNSGHIVADHSGHHIQLDEPDIVTASIFRVIDSVKHHRPLKDEPPSRH